MARKKNIPHPIDVQIGKRLRQGRVLRGMSQQMLGDKVEHPVTFQQIQKYESGFNRIAVSRLYEFSVALKLPFSFFFPDEETENATAIIPAISKQETKLLDGFRTLPAETQKAVFALIQSMRGS